jgi:hypothetical protein
VSVCVCVHSFIHSHPHIPPPPPHTHTHTHIHIQMPRPDGLTDELGLKVSQSACVLANKKRERKWEKGVKLLNKKKSLHWHNGMNGRVKKGGKGGGVKRVCIGVMMVV